MKGKARKLEGLEEATVLRQLQTRNLNQIATDLHPIRINSSQICVSPKRNSKILKMIIICYQTANHFQSMPFTLDNCEVFFSKRT